MIELTLGQVAAVTQGTLHGADPMTRVTGSVEFDSAFVMRDIESAWYPVPRLPLEN